MPRINALKGKRGGGGAVKLQVLRFHEHNEHKHVSTYST